MSKLIFTDIEDLRKVVKVNSSLPWETITPYIEDARDIFLTRYLGSEMVAIIQDSTDENLLGMVKKALGPLCMYIAAPEMGISIGDSGITVQNDNTKRSPASDAKIAAAVQSFHYRGFQAMDRLLTYLERNISSYPKLEKSAFFVLKNRCFILSADEFQNDGMVDIDYSITTYYTLLPSILQLQERNVREILGAELYESLKKKEVSTPKEKILIDYIIRYLANKTAEVYTSQTSREQRESPGRPEYKPVIRPLYSDTTENGNFFADQANYYEGLISNLLQDNAEEFGIESEVHKLDWNSKDKKIITSIS